LVVADGRAATAQPHQLSGDMVPALANRQLTHTPARS
jgi:hypothetical protein